MVVGCNALKLAAEVHILLYSRLDTVTVSVGDTVASFLVDPDPYTRNVCTMDGKMRERLRKAPV